MVYSDMLGDTKLVVLSQTVIFDEFSIISSFQTLNSSQFNSIKYYLMEQTIFTQHGRLKITCWFRLQLINMRVTGISTWIKLNGDTSVA